MFMSLSFFLLFSSLILFCVLFISFTQPCYYAKVRWSGRRHVLFYETTLLTNCVHFILIFLFSLFSTISVKSPEWKCDDFYNGKKWKPNNKPNHSSLSQLSSCFHLFSPEKKSTKYFFFFCRESVTYFFLYTQSLDSYWFWI